MLPPRRKKKDTQDESVMREAVGQSQVLRKGKLKSAGDKLTKSVVC